MHLNRLSYVYKCFEQLKAKEIAVGILNEHSNLF